jgi:excisionase family DNA binding protein
MSLSPRESPDRLAYGVQELAQRLGVSPSFVRLEIERGRLNSVRAGRRLLITRTEIERYLSDNTATGSRSRTAMSE